MKANNQTALIAGSMFLAGISMVLLVGETKGQGSLDPDGAPAPSMKSLDEISNQISEVGGEYRESSGQNMLVVLGNKASVLKPSGGWVTQDLTGLSVGEAPDFIVESNGNYLIVIHQSPTVSRVWAFSDTAGWRGGGDNYGKVTRVASSKGGVMAFSTDGSSGRVYGFRPPTGTFVENTSDTGTVTALVGSD